MGTPMKLPTTTVLVEAITEPPIPGFLNGGRRVGLGEKVRIELNSARELERRGKATIVKGTEKEEML